MSVALSRTMQTKEKPAEPAGGTPIWVWVVYALGILAVTVLAGSVLFTLGAYFLSNDVPVAIHVSVRGLVLWIGLSLLALVVFVRRRRRR